MPKPHHLILSPLSYFSEGIGRPRWKENQPDAQVCSSCPWAEGQKRGRWADRLRDAASHGAREGASVPRWALYGLRVTCPGGVSLSQSVSSPCFSSRPDTVTSAFSLETLMGFQILCKLGIHLSLYIFCKKINHLFFACSFLCFALFIVVQYT